MSLPPGVAQAFASEMRKFPGMIPEETIIFRAWLVQHETEYDLFDYNYRLGIGDDPGPNFSDAGRKSAILNSKLRIDAIGWKGVKGFHTLDDLYPPDVVYPKFPQAQATLIEVKRRAATGAVTQVSTYGHLWLGEFPNAPPPNLILVCISYSATITPALVRAGIRLDVVSADLSGLRIHRRTK